MTVFHAHHHPLHSLHKEMVSIRHWCSANLLHDYHAWIGLAVDALIISIMLLMLLEFSRYASMN